MMHADNIEMPMEFKFSGYVHLCGRYVHLDETSGSGEAGSHFRLRIDDRSRCAAIMVNNGAHILHVHVGLVECKGRHGT